MPSYVPSAKTRIHHCHSDTGHMSQREMRSSPLQMRLQRKEFKHQVSDASSCLSTSRECGNQYTEALRHLNEHFKHFNRLCHPAARGNDDHGLNALRRPLPQPPASRVNNYRHYQKGRYLRSKKHVRRSVMIASFRSRTLQDDQPVTGGNRYSLYYEVLTLAGTTVD